MTAFGLAMIVNFACASISVADTNRGYAIAGTVNDALGRSLPATQLTLENSTGQVLRKTLSDAKGNFRFVDVPPGTYEVVASKPGFALAASTVTVARTGTSNVTIALQSETVLSLRVATTRIIPPATSVSPTGNSQYTLTEHNIGSLPQGANTPINQVLLQMPGVVQDDQSQVHIDGEHEDLQWRVNGVMMPMDSFTGFGQIFNSFFIKRMSLIDGVLPVSYGYRDAGVLDLVTKDGCANPGGEIGFYGGQREWLQPSFEYGGCAGKFSYFYTGSFLHNNLAFSSATPGMTPLHNITNQGEGFGYLNYKLSSSTQLSLTTGVSVNNSELPTSPGLIPLYGLVGVNPLPDVGLARTAYPSTKIAESLNQDYYFGILALHGVVGPAIDYQVAYTGAYSYLKFNPDAIGDLIYQGVASTASHSELDNTLQTDLSRDFDLDNWGRHNLGAGFYVGEYGTNSDDSSRTFPASAGVQTSDIPVTIVENSNNINMLYGVYLLDRWQITEKLTLISGLRWDAVTGLVNNNMLSPRINLLYRLNRETDLHAGFARYFQTPDFLGISPRSFALFKDTTAAVQPGGLTLYPEKDYYWDAGALRRLGRHLTVEEDAYFRLSQDLIDLGQFGAVPIFAPFNYSSGRLYGAKTSATFQWENLSVRGNFTYSSAQGHDLASGQFNFTPAEVLYIKKHYVFLDHNQQYTASGGITYNWRSYLFSIDGVYGSGLRAGFANTDELGENFQLDLATEKTWRLPPFGDVKTRVVLINATDNINELRNGTGIGIFQPGYGPRRAVYGGVNVPLPALGGSAQTP